MKHKPTPPFVLFLLMVFAHLVAFGCIAWVEIAKQNIPHNDKPAMAPARKL